MAAEVALAAARNIGRLLPHETALFVCDIQEKFRPLIYRMPQIIQNTKTMIQCAQTMNVPVFITEQYPKGLGKTVPDIDVTKHHLFEKNVFSMLVPEVQQKLSSYAHIKSVLITGLEAHVCVQQTCLDLLEKGYDVHVLADAVSSQNIEDRQFAFERLRQSGAYITTIESALFMLVHSKDSPHFKSISAALKERRDALAAIDKSNQQH